MKHNTYIIMSTLRKLFMLITFAMGAVLPADAEDVAKLFKKDGSLVGTYGSILEVFELLTEDWMTIQMIDDEYIKDTSTYGCISVAIEKPVTLDLNGHTINIDKSFWVKKTKMEIIDSSSDKSGKITNIGRIPNISTTKELFYLNESSLTIREGRFYSEETIHSGYQGHIWIYGGMFFYKRALTETANSSTIYGGYYRYDTPENAFFSIAKGYVKTTSGRTDFPYMVVPAGAKLTYHSTIVYPPSVKMIIDLKDDESNEMAWLSDIQIMPCEEATNISVTIKKYFANTNWHDFCAPFDFTLTDDLLQNFEFAKIWDTEVNTKDKSISIEFVKLKSGTKITGYTPFLIKAKTTGKQDIVFNGVTPLANTKKSIDCSSTRQNFTFTSVMGDTSLKGKYALNNETNILEYFDDDVYQVTPLRFYMQVKDKATGASVQNLKVAMRMIGDETTGINGITDNAAATTGDVFNLQGVKVGTSTTGLPAGVYIQNGRKVVVK